MAISGFVNFGLFFGLFLLRNMNQWSEAVIIVAVHFRSNTSSGDRGEELLGRSPSRTASRSRAGSRIPISRHGVTWRKNAGWSGSMRLCSAVVRCAAKSHSSMRPRRARLGYPPGTGKLIELRDRGQFTHSWDFEAKRTLPRVDSCPDSVPDGSCL